MLGSEREERGERSRGDVVRYRISMKVGDPRNRGV